MLLSARRSFCILLYICMKKKQKLLFSFVFCACVSDCTRRNSEGLRMGYADNRLFTLRKTSLKKYYHTTTYHIGQISSFKGREQCRLTGVKVSTRQGLPTTDKSYS